jgi:Flp pilus assembly pilin Flp
MNLRPELSRWIADDSGADVIEYGLLAAFIGIVAVLMWQLLAAKVGEVYGAADSGVQGVSACTPNPGGGGCP